MNSSAAQARPFRADVLVAALALLAAVLVLAVLWLKTTYLSPGFSAKPVPGGWQVSTVFRADSGVAPAASLPADWVGSVLTRACAATEPARCVGLRPDWLVDSPMQLASASAQRGFFASQQALFELGQNVVLHRADGQHAAVALLPGGSSMMDERVALQTVVLLLIYALGCVMLAFVRRTPEVWLAFAMCAGYFTFMLARTWYTSRTWAQPESAWMVAMLAFKVGVASCGVCTALVLWRLSAARRITAWVYAVLAGCLAVLAMHTAGLIDSVALGYRAPMLVCLLVIVAAAVHAASGDATLQSRVTVRLVSLGFAPILIMTLFWNLRPDIQPIAFLLNFAVASAALPVVILVTRSAHYGMQRFWWGLWLVLAASTLGVVAAGVAALLSGLPAATSLVLGLALATWVTYLLRGWLEKRMLGQPVELGDALPRLMALAAALPQAQPAAWQQVLADTFEPQTTEFLPAPSVAADAPTVELLHTGDAMRVRDIKGGGALLLTGAARFTRSFTQSDLKLAQTMWAVTVQGLAARESFAKGAVQERQRIAADLHDDIGGKLLHLANAPGAEGAYARNTLEDLRTITRGLSAQPRQLHELVSDIRYQLAQRAERHGLAFDWVTKLGHAGQRALGAHQATVLTSICSELLRNAMQHTASRQITFDMRVADDAFYLIVSSDGEDVRPDQWQPGLGCISIRRRTNDLQGKCNWAARSNGGVVFTASWPLAAWLDPHSGAF